LGFNDFSEYKNSVVVNHKVASVSVWHETEDVYCMTVVGPDGENDRHNFAILPFDMKESVDWQRFSGIFVKNSVEEDFFIPKRGSADGNKIETLDSLEWSAIDDVDYIHQKFVTALGVPNSFLGFEESLSNKAALGSEDIRYARFVERIQQSFLNTLYDIVLIHLYIRGYKLNDINDVVLELTNPSHINELAELEIFQARLNAERDAKADKSFSNYWIKKNIWKMTDQEIEEEEDQLIRDSLRNFIFAQGEAGVLLTMKDVLDYNKAEAQAAKDAAQGGAGGEMGGLGGGGMGGMGDLRGGLGGGAGEFGGEELPSMGNEGLEGGLTPPDALEPPEDIEADAEENANETE